MTTEAPPQTPEGQAAALTTREDTQMTSMGGGMAIRSVSGREDLERYETAVKIPRDFQYAITKWVKGDQVNGRVIKSRGSSYVEVIDKVGLTADAYDYLNRALGVSFYLPPEVHDGFGARQPNPIHRKDYIYLRLAGVWYTPLGQLVQAVEDIEVDYNLVWMDARINAKDAKVRVDDQGLPMFDANGNPALTLTPEQELKALKTLSQLRSFGPRYAQTVGRVRILKMASGIRSLPIPEPQDYTVRVIGFRDRLTPIERIQKAGDDVEALYGRVDEAKPLSASELAEVQDIDRDDEAVDRDRLQAARVVADSEEGLPDVTLPGDDQTVAEAGDNQDATGGEQQQAPWAPEK